MEEMQSNQNNVTLGGFTDQVTDALFPNHGEMELPGAGGSSPWAGQVPMIARRPSHMRPPLYGTTMMGSNQLGAGIHRNGMFNDDQLLSSAFRSMSLSFRDDGGGEALANPGSVASRNGYCPADVVVPSASSMVNTFHNLTPAEHLKPNSGVWNFPMYTGMHGSDDASGTLRNLPSSPLQQRLFVDGQSLAYPPYQQMGSNCRCQDTDAEEYPPVHSQYTYPQMPQVGTPGVLWSRSNYSTMASASSSLRAPSVDQLRHHSDDTYWTVTVNPNGNSKRSSELLNNCSDCSCGNCEYCHIKQAEKLDQYGIRWSLDGVGESIFLLAKDHKGSCFLQRIFDIGAPEYVMKMHIIDEITKIPGQLIEVACNNHGTCVVQKLIETINSQEEASMIVSALSPGAVTLMMDVNGYHVAHHCLKNLSPEHKQFLLNAAIENYFELAKDCYGCCMIKKCIAHANKDQKEKLLYNITSRALDLSQHQYGNYVIHYIVCLKVMWATDIVLDKLEGYYGYLSMQKYSSHVVETCLKEAHEPIRLEIIHELINDPRLINILLHEYGNYVIQTALKECENAPAHAALVRAIRTHVAALRKNKYGKRILSKIHQTNTEY
ncbi:hypothetical protein ACQ4PT_052407 [Festuca glaucescens]